MIGSRIALGAMSFGQTWDAEPVTAEQLARAEAALEAALAQGITLVDLADIYTLGKAEHVLGQILRGQPGLRDTLVIQEKCGIVLADEAGPKRYDFSFEHIVGSVESSLRRLKTDRIDILALHRPDPLAEPEEVARAFDHLNETGKVLHFGVSNHGAAQIALLQRHVEQPLVVNQLQLSLAHHQLISAGVAVNNHAPELGQSQGLLDFCRLHDITVQAWSPLAGGRLFNPSYHPRLARAIEHLAGRREVSPEAVALAWLLRHPAGIQPVIGTLEPDRIARCAQACELELDRAEWFTLLEAARGVPVP